MPVDRLFPAGPPRDYLSAIWEHDCKGAREWIEQNPVYEVLNLCRALAYVAEGRIQSKEEGGGWALSRLPEPLCPVVEQAIARYRGDLKAEPFDARLLRLFAGELESRIAGSAGRATGE